MNNTQLLTLILSTLNLGLSVYNLYQLKKPHQPKPEKLVCSSLFCQFTTNNQEEMKQHEQQEHERN